MFESIQGRVNKLNTLINNLEGQWQGIGRGAFDVVQEGVKNDMKYLNRLLVGFTEAMDATVKAKGSNEDIVAQGMRKLVSDDMKGMDLGGSGSQGWASKIAQY
ncbi:WXG100 family type VII secretion target [Streptomyces cacaoi]|nr:WXG100 family type VII secretion target [Streptomyces cacaoi]